MADGRRFYWLKLHKDFFKRHEIRIIEDMPNGKDYILFYLKLLVESVSHEGRIRFSDTIPYNEQMLSTITGTNVDVVRSAIKAFTELEMLEVLDDGTIYMTEVKDLIGCETDWARQKRNQQLQKSAEGGNLPHTFHGDSTAFPPRDKSIENRDIENRYIDVVDVNTTAPTITEVRAFAEERKSIVEADRFFYYYDERNWTGRNGAAIDNWKATFVSWEAIEKKRREEAAEKGKQKNGFDFDQRQTDYDAILRGAANGN